MKLLLVIFALLACSTCSNIKRDNLAVGYASAMEKVKTSITQEGIPRQKIFYHFQLYGMSSSRMIGGVRGGYSITSESWSLPDGYTLAAFKHTYVGHKLSITQDEEEESFFPIKEKDYHEPSLEPFFDTLYLVNSHDKHVGEIDLHPSKMPQRDQLGR